MCEPTTLLAIGTSVVGFMAQRGQAKAEDSATRSAYNMEIQQQQMQYKQQNDQLSQEQTQRQREALVEQGRLRAAYGETGLGGNSMDRIVNENQFNLGQDLATMNANRDNLRSQTMMEGMGSAATAQSRFNSTKRPSFIDTGLQIAGSLAGDSKVKKYFP